MAIVDAGNATISGVGSVTAAASTTRSVAAIVAPSGDVSALASVTRQVSATITGDGDVSALASATRQVSATIIAAGSMNADGIDRVRISATINGVGTMSSAAASTQGASATINGVGSVRMLASHWATGGISIGSHPVNPLPVAATYLFGFDSGWNINGIVEVEFDSSWGIGATEKRFFRILGKCTAPECDAIGADPDDAKCGSPPPDGVRFITIQSASNLAELCDNLKNPAVTPPIQTTIDRIDLLSRPLRKRGFEQLRQFPRDNVALGDPPALPPDDTCQTLTPQDFCSVPNCLEFCLDVDKAVTAGAYIRVTESFHTFSESSGGIILGGSAEVIWSQNPTASGGIVISGSAEVVSGHYTYEMQGGIVLSGDISGNFLPNPLLRNMSGGIIMDGDISGNIASSIWHYDADGGIIIGGSAETNSGFSHNPEFPIVILGGEAEILASNWRFSYEMQGGINMSGSADYTSSYYSHDMDGGIEIGGDSENVSPYHQYEATGGVETGGTAYLGLSIPTAGGFSIGGSAEFRVTFSHEMTGGIVIDGGVDNVLSPYHAYNMDGGIEMGGEAEIDSSLLGIFVATAGFYSDIFDLSVEFSEIDATSDLTIDDGLITTNCGCGSLPLTLVVGHNLLQSNRLNDFLKRNVLLMDRELTMRYKSSGNSWQTHTHLRGIGEGGHQEKWLVLMEWACVDELSGEALGTNQWKFTLHITRSNLETGFDTETRFLITIPSVYPCELTDDLQVRISLNTQTGVVTLNNGFADHLVYADRIGLFKNAFWQEHPNLVFNIQEVEIPPQMPMYDLHPIFPVIEDTSA